MLVPKQDIERMDGEARSMLGDCISLRREIHAHPELSSREFRTVSLLSNFLKSRGLHPHSYDYPSLVCDTAPGPEIALRADMDALPVSEASGEPFSSLNEGVMHACGHDAHSAMLACAGVILSRFGKSVRLIFQPAEETGDGARKMIDSGALEGIRHIFGLHVWPALDTGTFSLSPGPVMAAHDEFLARIEGRGGHGAYPHLTEDTVLASSLFITLATSTAFRKMNPLESGVLSFCRIQGGNAANVIPSSVEISGTIRTFRDEVRKEIMDCLDSSLRAASLTTGVHTSFSLESNGPAVENDVHLSSRWSELLSTFMRQTPSPPTMGSEDFALYLKKVRGAFMFLGTGNSPETRQSKHSSLFRLDENALYYGIIAHTAVGLNGIEE